MRQCNHSHWLQLSRNNEGANLEVSDRLERLHNQQTAGHRFPGFAILLGNRHKLLALRSLGINPPGSSKKRAFGDIHLFSAPGTVTHPLLVADGDLFSRGKFNKAYGNPRCHENSMYQVKPSLGFESMENAVTRLYNQLLLPFSDLVCLFVDDLGGMAKVTEHLRSWLHPDQQFALTGIQPWLLLVVSKDLEVNEQLMLRELIRAQNGVKPRFRGYQVFNIAESVRQTRATKECQNRPWDRLQAKIWSLSGISRRRREGLLFSVPHFSSFIHSAVDRFVDPGKRPLEVVEASRLKMPVAADLETHLITFLKTMRSTETVTTLGIPIITSSFILDHYPPSMHRECRTPTR
jgi:hypothetical protein